MIGYNKKNKNRRLKWNKLLLLLLQVIEKRQTETEEHLRNADDDRELHLKSVEERDLVDGHLPYLNTNSNKKNKLK